jgi:hypothetical protein
MGFPSAAASFAPGSRVGGYVLEEQIGQGGMAVVFKALDNRLGRRVALKILAPALAADEAFRQRFIRESRAAAVVDDPHIIPLFEAGDADGVLFIAMRYVQGGDVRSMLARQGALDADRVAAIVAPVASALDAAHAAGLVHRDVKPANMLLDVRPGRPDHVYLSDFGLSKDAAGSGALTGTGLFLGTVDYAAPEQIDGRRIDGRTDQYALACATFEMLCGQPPFVRDQGLAVLHAHLSTPPPRLSAMRAGIPPAADAVLGRALAKSPPDRYPTCGDFSDALRGALGIGPYDAGSRRTGHPPTELAANIPRPVSAGRDLTADPFTPVPASPGAGIPGHVAADGGAWGPDSADPIAATAATPAWPPQPVQAPHQPSRTVPGPGRRPVARWPFVLLSVIAVAAAVAVAFVLSSRSTGTPTGAGAGGSGGAGSSTRASPVAPGWTAYRDLSGFSVQLPAGWAVDSATRTGTYPGVDFTGPAPGFHLFISWTSRTGTQALPPWQQQAAAFARNYPTYKLIRLQQVRYRSYNSAVWEFTNIHDGVLTHVIDMDVVVKPRIQSYAIELYGPQTEWSRVYGSMWTKVLATFEPAP